VLATEFKGKQKVAYEIGALFGERSNWATGGTPLSKRWCHGPFITQDRVEAFFSHQTFTHKTTAERLVKGLQRYAKIEAMLAGQRERIQVRDLPLVSHKLDQQKRKQALRETDAYVDLQLEKKE
jgi:hypothetical protein